MHRTRALAVFLLVLACAAGWLQARVLARRREVAAAGAAGAVVAARLGLTDLAIWTEARYTRHPALADRFTPFQDHPGALEHFPAGAVLPPPPHLRPVPGGGGETP